MKKASIRDVAREAGVSITTVSRALNGYDDVSEVTRKKIQQIVEELNYAPNANARSLGGKTTKVLALLVSGMKEKEESGFVYGMISGLYHVTVENDYEFILLTTDSAKQRKMNYLQLCRLKGIEGVMISGIRTDDPYYKELAKSEIPCVVFDADLHGKNVCSLSIDNKQASYDAVKHLIDNGHKKIAMMNGVSYAVVCQDRLNGYEQAMLENNLEIDSNYIRYCDFEEEMAYEETLDILKKHPEITAFFCASDVMAIGVINAINDIGKQVPYDYSVLGFDNILAAQYVNGGLTTICQEPFIMGKRGGEALVRMIADKEEANHINIPYSLIERKTVKMLK